MVKIWEPESDRSSPTSPCHALEGYTLGSPVQRPDYFRTDLWFVGGGDIQLCPPCLTSTSLRPRAGSSMGDLRFCWHPGYEPGIHAGSGAGRARRTAADTGKPRRYIHGQGYGHFFVHVAGGGCPASRFRCFFGILRPVLDPGRHYNPGHLGIRRGWDVILGHSRADTVSRIVAAGAVLSCDPPGNHRGSAIDHYGHRRKTGGGVEPLAAAIVHF